MTENHWGDLRIVKNTITNECRIERYRGAWDPIPDGPLPLDENHARIELQRLRDKERVSKCWTVVVEE